MMEYILFFDNLCSEGVLRSRQIKDAKLRDDDSLGLLAKFGADCIGAVGVTAENDHEQTTKSGDEQNIPTELVPNKTVSGVHDKELAYKKDGKFYTSTRDDPATYIAKLSADKLEELHFNESFTLSLAQEVLGKQRVTSFEKAFLHKDSPAALLIKRFDRTKDHQKLRMEDFAQILNVPSKGKYDRSYEEIAESIDKYSGQPPT
jgi:serine/threonine-protein kinase HipA